MLTIESPKVAETLERLFRTAEENDPPVLKRAIAAVEKRGEPLDDSRLYGHLEEAYIAVDRPAGRFLYALALSNASRTIVEFGTSFGISTIHLAAAVKDNGGGRVITSELLPSKVRQAKANVEQAGLTEFVDFREGDAFQTLANLNEPIDLVFLDGVKGLYLPMLQLLEPHLKPGAIVVADDLGIFPDLIRPYLDYVRQPSHGFVSIEIPIGDGIEVSVRQR